MINFSLFRGKRVPFVAATEINECGLACLAAVAAYHQGGYGLREIRRIAQHSGRGETLYELRKLAARIGLNARGLKVDIRGLAELKMPAILHWQMSHFVVLEKVVRSGLVVMDPSEGRQVVPWASVDRAYTGVALELTPGEEWREASAPSASAGLMDFVRPFSQWKFDIVALIAVCLIVDLLLVLLTVQLKLSVDHVLQSQDGEFALVLLTCFALVALTTGLLSVLRAWVAVVFSTRLGFALYDRFVTALHDKPSSFFLKHHTGDILHRARSVTTIQSSITAKLVQALLDVFMLVLVAVAMILAEATMAFVAIVFGVIAVVVSAALRTAAAEIARKQLNVAAKADLTFLENTRAARAIRLFGKEQVRIDLWRNKFVDVTNLALQSEKATILATHAARTAGYVGGAVLVGTGTVLVLDGSTSLGTVLMVLMLRAYFVERLTNCVDYLMELSRLQGHAERISEVLDPSGSGASREKSPTAKAGIETVPGIELREVWFRYGDDTPWILQGANLRIEPGEVLAITGKSGCGKSTLLGIMLGQLQPVRGEVLVAGRDLRTISPQDFSALVGAVLQDDLLFHGSIAENIAFFDVPIDFDHVKHCAMQANISSEIEAMPMGYFTLLAEAASDISGGQKQRLFIARALYHRPQILFFDEATSHLDGESEKLVGDAIRRLSVTRVLVAHRRETVRSASRVVELRDGQLFGVELAASGSSED